jgi:ribonuclease HI
MPTFQCVTCGTDFALPQATLDKFPGWEPKYCREHSPKRKGAGSGGAKKKKKRKPRPAGGSSVEENLTLAEVLTKFEGGPSTGVFTDGACTPNPGPGGWGVVWVREGEVVEQRHGHDPDTTNNRMELMAIIEAFEMLPEDSDATLYSDSKLCIDTLDSWAKGWEAKGWKRKQGPVKNLDLVKRAYALRKAHAGVKLEHIAAHSGHRWNEYADSLSTAWNRDEL